MTEQEKAFDAYFENRNFIKSNQEDADMVYQILRREAKKNWDAALEWQKTKEEKKRCETCGHNANNQKGMKIYFYSGCQRCKYLPRHNKLENHWEEKE